MKKPTKKIAQYSALAVGAVSLLPLSCKKDETANTDITVRDLNDVTSISGSTIGSHHGIDIDGNGTKDTYTYVYDVYGFKESGFYDNAGEGGEVLADTTIFDATEHYFIKALSAGTTIGSSSTTWNDYGYAQANANSENITNFAGLGDKYVGVKFKIGTETHYGWILVNLSADGHTFTVKKVGYNTVANASIKAGEE